MALMGRQPCKFVKYPNVQITDNKSKARKYTRSKMHI